MNVLSLPSSRQAEYPPSSPPSSHITLHFDISYEGLLVYDTKTLVSAAFDQKGGVSDDEKGSSIPLEANVKMGGRPYCLAVSQDNLRVAVAVGNKVSFLR